MKGRFVTPVAALLAAMLAAIPGAATDVPEWTGAVRRPASPLRAFAPEDRYAMAGGCYAVREEGGGYVVRDGAGYAVRAGTAAGAEPFHFQATDLGRYLLFDSSGRFLAASEGPAGRAVYAVTRSSPGATAGGVAFEQTDRAADEVARGPVNRATGRGAAVAAADEPGELADWEITGAGAFTLGLPATGQHLVAGPDQRLALATEGRPGRFGLEPAGGCARFPEIEVNVEGPVVGGETAFQEVRGFFDGHLHAMAFEFLGGRARCGRPWHRFGVTHALVDCPDHEPGGHGAALEIALTPDSRATGHNTDGWPTFAGWPRHDSLTHEQVYYRWLERAWRGGLRMFVNLLVDNGQLCTVYPYKRNSCNEMDGVRLQARRIRQLERYVDAQSGGPGEGWLRIVTDPFQARRVINEGKLAVVLGIEVSVPLDCGLTRDTPRCTELDIEAGLDEVYELGVRQMELTNKYDNGLTGVTGDSGVQGPLVNTGNLLETGRYWRLKTCGEHEGDAHDRAQPNLHDQSGAPDELSGRDSLVGGILALAGVSGVAPVYPEAPHCNVLGLSPLGRAMIGGMADRGMIVDVDHMSARARTQAVDLIEEREHSGIFSSHSWADDTIYPRIYRLGGVVTPHAGRSAGFVDKWVKHRRWADGRFYFGLGYGSDINGFSTQGAARGVTAPNAVTYPFEGFGGVLVHRQRSGTRTYDVNADGVAHYGMYPDWIEDLRRQAGDAIVADLERGAEAYLQMWERAIGIAPDACRADVPDLSDARLGALADAMTPVDVLRTLGQPFSRRGQTFGYCLDGDRAATITFGPGETLAGIEVSPRAGA